MPFIEEMKNVLLFVSELPEQQQREIAQSLSRRIVSYDYACTLSLDEVMKLTDLALADLSRTIDQLKLSGCELSMPLIKEIEGALPLIATLPDEWQKDIALVISKFVVAYDKSLTMTAEERKDERDREIADALLLTRHDDPD